jgi:ParB-like chromosome segregation protein Spo0J
MKITSKNINDLKASEYNPRQISKKQFKELCESIEGFGLVDPIIINKNPERENIVVGGHQRLKACKKLGFKKIPCVEVNLDINKEMELNVRLNKSGGVFDIDMLANTFDIHNLKEWGFADIELGINTDKIEEVDSLYTKKIKLPVYEPKIEKPKTEELCNQEKTNKLIEKIKKSNATKEEKDFLIMSAYRHLVFSYDKIAEFYAHSNKEVQGLMEDSALIIIDFNKAIENGYIELTKSMTIIQEDER